MQDKTKILIFIDWFLPGYKAGGPIRSVANITEHLSDEFEFIIVTSDRDFGDPEPYENVKLNIFTDKKFGKIIYLSPEFQNMKKYKEIFAGIKFDVVYFNSLFSFKFTILPLWVIKKINKSVKVITAPRGMLGDGALSLKKRKKQLFLLIVKLFGLFKGVLWHATDAVELKDIKKHFGENVRIVQVSNISGKIKPYIRRDKFFPKFIFLSRISEKKNLLFALRLFQNIKTDAKVLFSIYGTSEDSAYLEKCKSETKNIPDNIKIKFMGDVRHENVHQTLSEHHFYILPTLHENFGHSVFEAFSAGCPVIISDQTPWQNLEAQNTGWDIDLTDTRKFLEVIQKCIEMPQDEYDKMSKNAYDFAVKIANDKSVIEQTRKMFKYE